MFKQNFKQQLSQKISPQQIQAMNLIVLPIYSFEQRVNRELEENSALTNSNETAKNPDTNQNTPTNYPVKNNNYNSVNNFENNYNTSQESLSEHLLTQLNTYHLNDEQFRIAKFLIGSIDSNGYLFRSLSNITEDLAFIEKVYTSEDEVQKVLDVVQHLEPAGVGAKNLQECLLIQLQGKLQTKRIELAVNILENNFDELSEKQYQKLIDTLDITEKELKQAIEEIQSLNPRPGAIFSENSLSISSITPDFLITIIDDNLELSLNDRNFTELHISKDFQQMLKKYKESTKKFKEQKQTVKFLQQQLDTAKGFIDAITQRQQTLYITMRTIIQYQKKYFLSGDKQLLEPMLLKDIANTINMDISTVSRVVSSKYVDTPYGILLLKDFFSESTINSKGEKVSIKKVKEIIKNVIALEEKSLTDQELVAILKEKGYAIPRRRIATYREQLNIPVARFRKKI